MAFEIKEGSRKVLRDERGGENGEYTARLTITRSDTKEVLVDQECDSIMFAAHEAGKDEGEILGASIVTGATGLVVLATVAALFVALRKIVEDRDVPMEGVEKAAEHSGFSLSDKNKRGFGLLKGLRFWDEE